MLIVYVFRNRHFGDINDFIFSLDIENTSPNVKVDTSSSKMVCVSTWMKKQGHCMYYKSCCMFQLKLQGFQHIDALDPSEGMLEKAKSRNLYDRYICDYITDKQLDIPESKCPNVTTVYVYMQVVATVAEFVTMNWCQLLQTLLLYMQCYV